MTQFRAALLNDLPPERLHGLFDFVDQSPYETLFISDERFYKNTYSQLTLAAEHTSRIQLGTGVTNPYTRHPAVTAAAIATLDEVSDGRALLGLGAGSPVALGPAGIEQEHPITTVRNAVRVIRALHGGKSVTMIDGAFECNDLDMDFKARRKAPIYVAGRGPQILSLGGHVGDGVIAGAGLTSVAGMEYAMDRIQIGAEKGNRSLDEIDIVCWAFLSISEEKEMAYNSISPLIAEIVHAVPTPALEAIGIPTQDIEQIKQLDEVSDLSPDQIRTYLTQEVIEQFAIAGTPESCREHVNSLISSGIDDIAVLAFENSQFHELDNLKVFADEVISEVT